MIYKRTFVLLVMAVLFLCAGGIAFASDYDSSAVDFHRVPMGSLRQFASEDELRNWVKNHKLSVVIFSGQSLRGGPSDPRYDCDEYAEDYRRLAERDGFVLGICPVNCGNVWGVHVIDVANNHVGNLAQIGNTYYYVEPFPPNSRVVRIIDAD